MRLLGRIRSAFTLFEVMIVVLVLGILAAIIVPYYANASSDAQDTATHDNLERIRRSLSLYYVKNSSFPQITAGSGTWGELLGQEYLRSVPQNLWVGGANATVIVLGSSPDSAYQTAHGWIYDPATGNVCAGSFDASDKPIAK